MFSNPAIGQAIGACQKILSLLHPQVGMLAARISKLEEIVKGPHNIGTRTLAAQGQSSMEKKAAAPGVSHPQKRSFIVTAEEAA